MCEDRRAEQLSGADDLYAQQAPVSVEDEDDITPAKTFYNDVFHGRSRCGVVLDLKVEVSPAGKPDPGNDPRLERHA